jgi:5-methylcytosine-specific restriction enzyme subunit McrC
MKQVERFSIVEYGDPENLIEKITNKCSISKHKIREYLTISGDHLAKELNFKVSPLIISFQSVKAVKFSGLIQVAPGIELEIIPKFLSEHSTTWREDFFYIATLSKHGYLLNSDRISASISNSDNLHNLIALAFSKMYLHNSRKSLRTYTQKVVTEYSYDGEVDFVDLFHPVADGYRQDIITYDKTNKYNSVIYNAAKNILPNLTDPRVIALIERIISDLRPQKPTNIITKNKLPSRSKHWQPLYDLSVDILSGLGLSMKNGNLQVPGYVIDSWRCWESLIGIILFKNKPMFKVKTQKKFKLGTRKSHAITDANVQPDFIVTKVIGDEETFIIDAKYKNNIKARKNRISESDIYESIAFMKATECNKTILIYPGREDRNQSGNLKVFETIDIDGLTILGVELSVLGISQRGALNEISTKFSLSLTNALESMNN